jgi:hypothetical protein
MDNNRILKIKFYIRTQNLTSYAEKMFYVIGSGVNITKLFFFITYASIN